MKILLLQLKRIGDLILTTPAIAVLRKNFPDAHITLAVSNECAELLPAISNVDRVLLARRNLRDVAMVSSVAGKRFDYCIDFTRNDRSAFLTLWSGARRRVASYRVREQSITHRTRQKFIDLSGKTDLLTLAALVGQAQLLVTVDSAPVHFAAASHTPQVILFGPTNPFHWRPTDSPALILHGKSEAPVTEFASIRPRFPMSEISTEAVISAMDSLLPRHAAAHSS